MIHIADDIYLDADRYCFILYEEIEIKTGKRQGEKELVPVSYHATYEQVVNALMNMSIKRTIISKDLIGCVRLIEGAKQKFSELLKLKKDGKNPD
jgi:hypothetical protein